jgi:selenocysteine lyase/cysteine desulfurase
VTFYPEKAPGPTAYTCRPVLVCKRSRFALPDGVHYLNCAYMAPLARAVRTAGIAGIDRRAAPHLIRPADFFDESDQIRCLFSRLVNAADPNRVAIIPSVSYGLATVARNAPVSRGQSIVVLEEQFPSNVYAWRRLCAERGAELKVVKAPDDAHGSRGIAWNARVLAAIDHRTAVVALPHVHWTDGTLFDLERIGERARECRAWLAVDGTQSVGALPFDVQRIRPDALVCAGYKWLLGPYSVGLAYYGPALDDGVPIEENWITRRSSESFAELVRYRDEYQPGAIRYDVGERSNFTLLPMLAAALELVLSWTVSGIQTYCRSLTDEPTRVLRERGYRIEVERRRGGHLFGVRMRHPAEAERLTERLRHRQVSVSMRGDAIRISPHLYNDATDMDALLDALD